MCHLKPTRNTRAWMGPRLFSAGRSLDQVRDQSGPSRLVRGTQSFAGVAVEELVEKHVVAEVRVLLHLGILPEDWATAVTVAQKNPSDSPRELVRHFG
jgi:hypothetical protein